MKLFSKTRLSIKDPSLTTEKYKITITHLSTRIKTLNISLSKLIIDLFDNYNDSFLLYIYIYK